ncbi:MAG TPA: HAD family hydrolase [Candidatus Dormibacteraeota bacterium]|nr:HAD family hydrolase [Candidatus Dormibacteraeota bacterium]
MRPKLLISDLDGTLLDERLQVDPRDVAAVGRAHQAGLRVGVATGRMYRSGLPHALALGADLPLICYQGALIRELPRDASERAMAAAPVLLRRELSGDLGIEVLEICRRRGYTLNVYQDDHLYVDQINDDVRFYTGIAQVKAEVATDPSLDERVSRGSTKLMVVSSNRERFQAALKEFQHLLGERAEVTRSLIGFCEITALGVDKGQALRWLCRHLEVDPRDVVAVGDAPNDLPLLAAAGTKVAVETAAAEVREAADWLVPGPGGAGLAEVVRRILLAPASSR